MGLQYRKAKVKLGFREGKPEVYKLRQLIYPPIKEEDLVKYAANAAAIPPATMQACVEAIAQAIIYYAINGMRVVIPGFGGFYLAFRSKVAKTPEEIDEKSIRYVGLQFQPLSALRDVGNDTDDMVLDGKVYNV